jgi:hypothetical protein
VQGSLLKRVEVSGNAVRLAPAAVLVSRRLIRNELVLDYGKTIGAALRDMPRSVLWAPGVFNLAPLAWAYGLKFTVPFRCEAMEQGLDRIKARFRQLYPSISWDGSLIFEGDVDAPLEPQPRVMALYSGGLDSVHTIYRHFDERPELVMFDWTTASTEVRADTAKMAADFGRLHQLPLTRVATNLTAFLNWDKLAFAALRKEGLNWWTGIQHGLAMAAAAAPVAYAKRVGTVYIASSYTDDYNAPWGSAPEIDNNIAWPGTRVVHDSFDRSRQRKIEALATDRPIPAVRPLLRVCNRPLDGLLNCGTCEKCLRTMAGLLVEGEQPSAWGFAVDQETAVRRMTQAFASERLAILDDQVFMWSDVKKRAKASVNCPPELARWLEILDLAPHHRRTMRREKLAGLVRRFAPTTLLNFIRRMSKWRRRRVHRKAVLNS